jgi:hypothetical protein
LSELDSFMENITNRDTRLDFAKGLVKTFVLYAHLHPYDITLTESSSLFFKGLAFALKQFYWQGILIVVPTFLLVGFYITYNKLEQYGTPYLWKRLIRLVQVTVFWVALQFAAYYALVAVLGKPYSFQLKADAWHLFLQGGPNLPLVQGSVFYYFIVLIILTFPTYLFHITRNIKWFAPLVGGAVFIATVAWLEARNLNGKGLSYWRIEQFFVYVPLAYFLRNRPPEQRRKLFPIFTVLWLIFSIQDVIIRQSGGNINVYSRVSLIFGSAAFVSWLLSRETVYTPKWIIFFSIYSLGLFAVHKFWQALFIILITPLGLSQYLYPFNLELILIAIATVFLSVVSVYYLGRTKLRFAVL